MPFLGLDVRNGKNAIWMPGGVPNWPERLLEVLKELAGKNL